MVVIQRGEVVLSITWMRSRHSRRDVILSPAAIECWLLRTALVLYSYSLAVSRHPLLAIDLAVGCIPLSFPGRYLLGQGKRVGNASVQTPGREHAAFGFSHL
jgi:hypothetical protein